MIKILHTADWHLGQVFYGYERDAEHDAFLSWLVHLIQTEEVDALLVAGDIFDVSNPSAAAQRRFFRFLHEAREARPSLQIIIVAGNHDSAARLEAPSPLLDEQLTRIVGIIPRSEYQTIDYEALTVPLMANGKREAWCMAVPFLRQGDYPPKTKHEETANEETDITTEEAALEVENTPNDPHMTGIARMYKSLYQHINSKRTKDEPVIAMGHLHVYGAALSANDRSERTLIGGLDAFPAAAFPQDVTYWALGHIHKAQAIGGVDTMRYAGSPLPMSFSETHYTHQVVIITLDHSKEIEIRPVEVPIHAPLQLVPPQPLPPDEVITALQTLPDATDETNSDPSRWPYIEVQVLMSEPDPSFRNRVENAIQQKAVRLTTIQSVYPKATAEDNTAEVLSLEDLHKMDPLAMLERAFSQKYHAEMPEEMKSLFNQIVKEAYEN